MFVSSAEGTAVVCEELKVALFDSTNRGGGHAGGQQSVASVQGRQVRSG